MQPLFCICFSTQCPNWIDSDLHWTGVCSSGMAGTSKLWVDGLPGVGAVRLNNCRQRGSGHQHDQHWAAWTGTWCSIHSACHCTEWGGRKCEHHPGHQHMWVDWVTWELWRKLKYHQWMPLELNVISSLKLIKKWGLYCQMQLNGMTYYLQCGAIITQSLFCKMPSSPECKMHL